MNFRNLFNAVLVFLAWSIGTQAFAARTTTYYHNDGLGSVVAATNEVGQVLWRKDYAPFGEQIDTTPDTEKQSYTGKPHDDATGLTYFGGRYYDPQVARFMSVDPVAFVDDNTMSFNRYLYVNNNPYKYVDPDGEFLNFAAKFMLDVGLNIAINYATSGSIGLGMALKDSAMGVLNPAKTVAKVGKLAKILAKAEKKMPCALSCFVAGTTVLTERGYVPIETLEVGDNVWAHDPDTGVTALKPILRTFVNSRDSVWKLVIEKDGHRYLHEVTGSHPYYVVDSSGKGTWVQVAQLHVGALLKTEGGADARVVSLNDTGEVLTTYNFEVADINTYYVSAAKVLVHNCGGATAKAAKTVEEAGADLAKVAGRNRVSGRTAGGKQIDIDLAGKAHFEKTTKKLVPTPHVKESAIHVGPNGKSSISDSVTRPAEMQDIRTARKLLERQP